jgi:hypothetical protein
MATLVTAFMTNINDIDFRSYEKYIELGKKLLCQPIPTVCFLEKHIYDKYFDSNLQNFPYTTFLTTEKRDIYLFSFESELVNYHVNTDNPTKDTPGYMFVQCYKTEWVRRAIEANPYNTSNFIWIDFGIFHMIDNSMEFALKLDSMCRKTYPRVRIASCVNPNQENNHDIYSTISWFFAGSVFGGNSQYLVQFAKQMKEICIDIIINKKRIMWEVNIWYLLYQKHPGLFSPYFANHDITILKNY